MSGLKKKAETSEGMFTINQEFASKFQHRKKREEVQKAKEKYRKNLESN